jgi:DNA-binding MarR family transcriptional regulator
MRKSARDEAIAAVRHFNRFYTQHIGILQKQLLQSPFSLVECRILRELAVESETTATVLGRKLEIDRGYLSRILSSFARRRLIRITTNRADGRQKFLQLTEKGRKAHEVVHARAQHYARSLLAGLTKIEQNRLLGSMRTIEHLLRRGGDKRDE